MQRSLSLLALAAGCAVVTGNNHPGGTGGDADLGVSLPDLAPVVSPDLAPTVWSDFPATPVIDMSGPPPVPMNAPALFGPPGTGAPSGGPCALEPDPGSLYPQNWLRPRFRLKPVNGQNLFEIRLQAPNEVNDLVVYTTQTTWTMDAPTWSAISAHLVDTPITFTVRGAAWDGTKLTQLPALGSTGTVSIAPVSAQGTIVYWTTSNGSALRGFSIGEETVHDVLTPSKASTACIGCHSSTPDGMNVAFSASSNSGSGTAAQIGMRTLDVTATVPSFISPSAATLLARDHQQLPVFSKAHWTTGDRIAVTMLVLNGKTEIVWTDLEASSTTQGVAWDVLARDGDGNEASGAQLSHDGTKLVYASGTNINSGVTLSNGILRIVPWNARKGGTSLLVAGASDPNFNQFYSTFSPDDKWLAFNRLPHGAGSYNNSQSEVYVLPSSGGTATRLSANDPPMCSGKTSPGVTNSWPKWSPNVGVVGARSYYWLTFSSTRSDSGNPQLYVTPIVVENGKLTTYPALYLWNQPANQSNHTPAWDNFQIPIS